MDTYFGLGHGNAGEPQDSRMPRSVSPDAQGGGVELASPIDDGRRASLARQARLWHQAPTGDVGLPHDGGGAP